MSTNANINENGKATAVLICVCGQWWPGKFVDNGRPGCMGFGRNVPVQKVEMPPSLPARPWEVRFPNRAPAAYKRMADARDVSRKVRQGRKAIKDGMRMERPPCPHLSPGSAGTPRPTPETHQSPPETRGATGSRTSQRRPNAAGKLPCAGSSFRGCGILPRRKPPARLRFVFAWEVRFPNRAESSRPVPARPPSVRAALRRGRENDTQPPPIDFFLLPSAASRKMSP